MNPVIYAQKEQPSRNYSSAASDSEVELRTGAPYARLIAQHQYYSVLIAGHLAVDENAVLPTFGTTGAIEAVRNHVFRGLAGASPRLLTVSPEYWRAREAFAGFGFDVTAMETEPDGFSMNEEAFIARAAEESPHIVYLSLPNNPTGGVFDAHKVIGGIPEKIAIVLDLTLPSFELDTRSLTAELFREFSGRTGMFIVGSTSKSHDTAEYRIGWAISANLEEAGQLRAENRNVVCSMSVEEVKRRLSTPQPTLNQVRTSMDLLARGESEGRFTVIRPRTRARTVYALLKTCCDPAHLRRQFNKLGIRVMWGSELGLTDGHIRIETSEPANIEKFIEAINAVELPENGLQAAVSSAEA